MSLREEIDQVWNDAQDHIRSRSTPPGILPRDDEPDLRFVTINENFAAVTKALRLIADRIDAAEASQS